jgi:nitrile hydratase
MTLPSHDPHDHDHDDHDHDHDHHHGHDHAHGHRHPPQRDHDADEMSPYEVLEETIRTLLIEKGVLTNEEISAQVDFMDSRTPSLGAKVVAHAWVDPEFKKRLLKDTRAALAELGIDIGTLAEFRTVENTPRIHNVVVCTLCSCYPTPVLGPPPVWYKSAPYRSRVVREPRSVLAEFGTTVPDEVEVRVWDSNSEVRYLVLPERPAGTETWSEGELAALVTRNAMIGVERARRPADLAAGGAA